MRPPSLVAVPITLLLALLAACGGDPTPEAPWTGRQDVDDIAVAAALRSLLPEDQRTCVENAFDDKTLQSLVTQQLDQVANNRGFEPDDHALLGSCLTDTGPEGVMATVLAAVVETMPQSPAPSSLASTVWPTEASAANDLLRGVAQELGAEYSAEGGRIRLDRTSDHAEIVAMDWTPFAPGPNASQMITVFALGADWDVIETARDQDIIWVRWTTTGDGIPFEVLQWGPINTPWTYAVTGESQDQIDATAALVVEHAGP